MPQLVNRPCAICSNRISSIMEGEFCVGCAKPIHVRCKSSSWPTMELRCATCGAERTNQEIVQQAESQQEAAEVILDQKTWQNLTDVGLSKFQTEQVTEDYIRSVTTEKSWPVTFKSFLGGFQVEGKWAVQLAQPASMTISDGNRIQLVARYDPPGSGWLALFATMASMILVFSMSLFLGFGAAPGWLIWYFAIRAARRQNLRILLDRAKAVVTDGENERLAFRVTFLGKLRWIAFEVKQGFPDASRDISAVMDSKCREGKIIRPTNLWPIVVFLAAFIVAIVGIIYWSVVRDHR